MRWWGGRAELEVSQGGGGVITVGIFGAVRLGGGGGGAGGGN